MCWAALASRRLASCCLAVSLKALRHSLVRCAVLPALILDPLLHHQINSHLDESPTHSSASVLLITMGPPPLPVCSWSIFSPYFFGFSLLAIHLRASICSRR
jgi:hypothetical protein